MNRFICMAGTSIQGGPHRGGEFADLAGQITATLETKRRATKSREEFLIRASAETNGLVRAGAGEDDDVALLISETKEGQICAQHLAALIRNQLGCQVDIREIKGLQMTDGRRSQKEAIDSLFSTLDDLTRERDLEEVRINATGGFKGTLPYVVLYAMVEDIEVSYVFEGSNALIRLPPLPVRFDWARLAAAAPAIFAICERGALREAEWRGMLPADYAAHQAEYDTLFLYEDGLISLSGPGFLVKRKLEASESVTRILLSPQARQALDAADSTLRRDYETILSRARNPLARRAGRHRETLRATGSDLLVWKTIGHRNAPRMLYWEEGRDVCVAGLLQHDAYDAFWQRAPKSRQNYERAKFTEWAAAMSVNYADLAEAARALDHDDPAEREALQEELRRAVAEGDSAQAAMNRAVREARREGLEQGRAEARNTARQEIERAAAAARRRAANENVALRQRIQELESYAGLLQEKLDRRSN